MSQTDLSCFIISQMNNRLLEIDFYKLLKSFKGKSQYDCMVMCSGGKDSTFALYQIVKKYKMNPLVFTFDHGFENEDAMRNIQNAVKILDVDFLYYKTSFMSDAFRLVIEKKFKVHICHLCALWYVQLAFDTAAKYKIPLIVGGWRMEQMEEKNGVDPRYVKLSEFTRLFINKHLCSIEKYKKFPLNKDEAIGKNKNIQTLSPHWFVGQDDEKNNLILQNELGWKAPKLSYPKGSTNCLLNFASTYLSMKKFGYTHYQIEMEKQVANGEISKEDAAKKLKVDFDKEFINKKVLSKLKCKI